MLNLNPSGRVDWIKVALKSNGSGERNSSEIGAAAAAANSSITFDCGRFTTGVATGRDRWRHVIFRSGNAEWATENNDNTVPAAAVISYPSAEAVGKMGTIGTDPGSSPVESRWRALNHRIGRAHQNEIKKKNGGETARVVNLYSATSCWMAPNVPAPPGVRSRDVFLF